MGGSATDVHDNQRDVLRVVEGAFYFAFRISSAAIVSVRIVPIDAMNDRIALVIGFNLESRVSVSKRLHLLAKERLKIENPRFHRIHDFGAERPVVRQEIEEPHCAGFPTFRSDAHLPAGPGLSLCQCSGSKGRQKCALSAGTEDAWPSDGGGRSTARTASIAICEFVFTSGAPVCDVRPRLNPRVEGAFRQAVIHAL